MLSVKYGSVWSGNKEVLCVCHNTLYSAPLFYSSDKKRSDFHVMFSHMNTQCWTTIITPFLLRICRHVDKRMKRWWKGRMLWMDNFCVMMKSKLWIILIKGSLLIYLFCCAGKWLLSSSLSGKPKTEYMVRKMYNWNSYVHTLFKEMLRLFLKSNKN